MNVTYAIEGYLDHVKNTLLQDFSGVMLNAYIYDEALEFGNRASSFIRKQLEFQKEEGQPVTDWAFLVWNRGDLDASNSSRPLKISVDTDGDGIINSTTTMKTASLEIQIKIYTNSVELGETIEEYFHILSGELTSYVADYKAFGDMKCSSNPSTTTTFEKEELNEVGSVIGIGLSASIHFPVLLPVKDAKIIEFINNKIWDGFDDLDENKVLLDDMWIPSEP